MVIRHFRLGFFRIKRAGRVQPYRSCGHSSKAIRFKKKNPYIRELTRIKERRKTGRIRKPKLKISTAFDL